MAAPMSNQTRVVAVVPVRAQSKGLPGKNVRDLAGKPLYRHAVDQAVRTTGACIVTTDIEEVLAAALPESCIKLRRDLALAADDTPMERVIEDVIRKLALTDETILLLQATSPLRLDEDIRTALGLHATGKHDLVMTVTAADPGVLKYGTIRDGEFRPLSRPGYCFTNRQQLPTVFRPNGAVYVFSAATFRHCGWRFPHERIGATEMPQDRSFDIDTLADLEAASRLLSRRP